MQLKELKCIDITIFFRKAKGSPRFDIYDVYKVHENSDDVKTAAYGYWERQTGLMIIQKNIWKRRHNLSGHQIR